MEPVRQVHSRLFYMPETNIDTDQIIPARYLKTTEKKGLGRFAFADRRYDERGLPTASLLNVEKSRRPSILLAGDNFGCGSSREHAPWALLDYGIRVVISTRIADIFRNNALKNGLLAIEVEPEFHQVLTQAFDAVVSVDLESCRVTVDAAHHTSFKIDPFARHCLLKGIDSLDFLLEHQSRIAAYEEMTP